jgi:hypothetical protein
MLDYDDHFKTATDPKKESSSPAPSPPTLEDARKEPETWPDRNGELGWSSCADFDYEEPWDPEDAAVKLRDAKVAALRSSAAQEQLKTINTNGVASPLDEL